jgi:hypothetical protein
MNQPVNMEECYRKSANRNGWWAGTLLIISCVGWFYVFKLDKEVHSYQELINKVNDKVIQVDGEKIEDFWDWIESDSSGSAIARPPSGGVPAAP